MGVYDPKKPKAMNAVSVTGALVVLVLGYLAYVLVPPYWQIFQLQGILKSACNEAYQQWSDEKVMDYLMRQVPRTRLPLSKDNFRFTRIPYTAEERREEFGERANDPQIVQLAETRGATCVMEYRYARTIHFPLIEQELPVVHQGEVRASLKTVRYDQPFQCRCAAVSASEPDWALRSAVLRDSHEPRVGARRALLGDRTAGQGRDPGPAGPGPILP